jgi:hypothetical protein
MRYKFYNYFRFKVSGQRLKSIVDVDIGFMISSRASGKKRGCKGVAERIDVKSDPFVCLLLKPTP